MAWSRRVALVSTLLLASLVPVPAGAQPSPDFLLLGVDATGDAQTSGAPMPDTWIDINALSVATIGTDLVFHLGLEGTTTEAGSYCWMAAFEFDGTEYVGLDCYEAVAYENTNAASGASRPSTSRGTNVASSVTFDETGALITIPLAAIGAGPGAVIEDIYGLTYVTRALNTVDTIPDAKRTAAADESLGSYCIGGCAGGAIAAGGNETIAQALNGTKLQHSFDNATNATYLVNGTIAFDNVTVRFGAGVQAGSVNVTILRGNATLASFAASNATHPPLATTSTSSTSATVSTTATSGAASASASGSSTSASMSPAATEDADRRTLTNASGNWTIRIEYTAFVGTLSIDIEQAQARPASTSAPTTAANNVTVGEGDDEETPAPAVAFLMLALLAAVVARRRS